MQTELAKKMIAMIKTIRVPSIRRFLKKHINPEANSYDELFCNIYKYDRLPITTQSNKFPSALSMAYAFLPTQACEELTKLFVNLFVNLDEENKCALLFGSERPKDFSHWKHFTELLDKLDEKSKFHLIKAFTSVTPISVYGLFNYSDIIRLTDVFDKITSASSALILLTWINKFPNFKVRKLIYSGSDDIPWSLQSNLLHSAFSIRSEKVFIR